MVYRGHSQQRTFVRAYDLGLEQRIVECDLVDYFRSRIVIDAVAVVGYSKSPRFAYCTIQELAKPDEIYPHGYPCEYIYARNREIGKPVDFENAIWTAAHAWVPFGNGAIEDVERAISYGFPKHKFFVALGEPNAILVPFTTFVNL